MPETTHKSPYWSRPAGVICITAGYLLIHLLLRGYFSSTLSTDDMFENVLVQELKPGYQVRQPPLYEWLLYSLQILLGPTIWSFLVLKYSLVMLFALFLYGTARKAIANEQLAALSVFSYVALYQIGFNLHEGVTHTGVLMATSAASILCFIALLERRTISSALLFGLAVGLGMLSKHSYYIVPVALFAAALSMRFWRAQLRFSFLMLAGVVALLVSSPYFYWLLINDQALFGSALVIMRDGNEAGLVSRMLTGELRLLVSLLGFSVPFLPLVVLLFFPSLFRSREAASNPTASNRVGQLLQRTLLISIGLAFVGVLLSGAQYIKERHMHPILLLLPVVLFYRISLGRVPARSLKIYSGVLAVLVVAVLGVRVSGFLAPDKRMCGGYCRHMKPYEQLGAELKSVFPEVVEATVVSLDEYTGGNLRMALPEARHIISSFQPSSAQRKDCFVVWDMGDDGGQRGLESALTSGGFNVAQAPDLENTLVSKQIDVSWPHLWKRENFRKTSFGVAKIDRDSDLCR
ncbi:glycosyltransferase family 39 protein [Pseudovibrio sp. Tun.PSC04-5.I4]|uniref:ArnT family glycosyltransferase n=1 Tax=Pseudovibrio sp. Tun.PSC04-5.I4 TaxID=1798213 RepID=UPI0008901B5E|nr:glycosyltransferase family 39 protein [Pseudovibrio sp. Tun.PSC04-5.I4]SDR39660.1 Dolichyl-phosphate-mannose-protein mannosyltransferase [Pseudovibrio sp. Tun.PSC04-5.I4]